MKQDAFEVVQSGMFEELSTGTMGDEGMSEHAAYTRVKQHLKRDAQPARNLGTFVTTHTDKSIQTLMAETASKNMVNHNEYPSCTDMEKSCVRSLANLFHAPASGKDDYATGASTVGSSEAIMLGVLAMKRQWQTRRKAQGRSTDNPSLIMSSSTHVCWMKAARYFDIRVKYLHCTRSRHVLDPAEAVATVDDDTIGICAILGTTHTGAYEDVKAVNDLLIERNLDVVIHVDAASGGFVAPFVRPDLEWDFRLQKVVSINVSGHKYGLVQAGVGWIIWRSPENLPSDLIFSFDYLDGDQISFTLNFSKSEYPLLSTSIIIELTRSR